jgi:hypothetical protein
MSWTNIPNANLAIGAPIRSIDQLALRDNPIAIAEGATGAPRVRAEALNGGQSGSAPIYAARAWVNFDGTGTVAIRASGNVSSITDNGTGDYTVNFTTAMPDANYAACYGGSSENGNMARKFESASSSAYRFTTRNSANAIVADDSQVFVAIFR